MQPDDPKPKSSYWSRQRRDAVGSMVTLGSICFVASLIGIGYALVVAGHVSRLFIAAAVASALIAWIGIARAAGSTTP